jgi:DNA-binding NtrC family response regulator
MSIIKLNKQVECDLLPQPGLAHCIRQNTMRDLIRVLWIDPDYDSIAPLVRELEEAGYFIDYADSAARGLALAKRSTHEVAIIELMLEDTLGTDVWRSLYRRHRDMVAIITTAVPSLYQNVKPSRERVIAYMLKPVQQSLLLLYLQRVRISKPMFPS